MKSTNKTGRALAVLEVKEDSDVFLVTRDGKILRIESESIRKTGPLRLRREAWVSMEATDAVAAACAVQEAEQVESEEAADNGQGDLSVLQQPG
ncbi:MAG: hypothetical protein QM757_07655 [Paludibaculum sp.]